MGILGSDKTMPKITIEGESLEEIRGSFEEMAMKYPEKLENIIEELNAVLKATEKAKEDDPNGRARKKIVEYAGIDDDEKVSLMLRILEKGGLVEHNKNRWRSAD